MDFISAAGPRFSSNPDSKQLHSEFSLYAPIIQGYFDVVHL